MMFYIWSFSVVELYERVSKRIICGTLTSFIVWHMNVVEETFRRSYDPLHASGGVDRQLSPNKTCKGNPDDKEVLSTLKTRWSVVILPATNVIHCSNVQGYDFHVHPFTMPQGFCSSRKSFFTFHLSESCVKRSIRRMYLLASGARIQTTDFWGDERLIHSITHDHDVVLRYSRFQSNGSQSLCARGRWTYHFDGIHASCM